MRPFIPSLLSLLEQEARRLDFALTYCATGVSPERQLTIVCYGPYGTCAGWRVGLGLLPAKKNRSKRKFG